MAIDDSINVREKLLDSVNKAANAESIANTANTTASGAIPKNGGRGDLMGYGNVYVSSTSSSHSITYDSSYDCRIITTTGATTLNFTAAPSNICTIKVISLYASSSSSITISGASWANKASAPSWGSAGTYLVLVAHFIHGRVILTVADNTQ